jgi:hypothetical protein
MYQVAGENALNHYFIDGAIAARIDRSNGRLEINSPAPCYYTPEYGFEVRP